MFRTPQPSRLRPDVWSAAALLFVAMTPKVALAAGVEDTVGGAEGLGRAAHYGRTSDFMAVIENPANLAIAEPMVGGELRVPWLRSCFDRAASAEVEYRQTPDGDLLESFDEVCNEGFILPTGNFGWAESFGDYGFGLGFFTPNAVGSSQYGTDRLRTFQPQENERGTPTLMGLESPTRQMNVKRIALGGFVLAGVGVQPTWWLRIGVASGFGMVQVESTQVVSTVGGTFNDTEVLSTVKARDWVVGRAVGSIVLTPLPWLELFSVLQFHSDVRAKGKMTLEANGLKNVPTTDCVGTPDDQRTSKCTIDGVTLQVPFNPLEVTLGMRFVKLRNGVRDTRNTLRDEIFDLEFDVTYAKTSNVDAFRVSVYDPDSVDEEEFPRVVLGNYPNAQPLYPRNETNIPKNWRDTWTFKVGSDINIVPSRLAVRFGASYATNAVPTGYMNIDYWPVRKIGAHAGLSFGLTDKVHLHVGYAHIFYENRTVPVGEGQVFEIASNQPNQATAVNEGNYRAQQDIFSAQLNIGF